jgi:outer membrane protein assembly factor BamB
MKRVITAVVAFAVLAGVFVVMRFAGGCGARMSRVAEKRVYDGPATLAADTTDWPRWRGPRGDGISREPNLADLWPESGPPELWAADVGIGYSSPIAAGGRVYLFSLSDDRETLTCFDANSGKIVWNNEGGPGRTKNYPGTRATPTIDGDDIITYGGAGELACRDLATGSPRWTVNILGETRTRAVDWGTASTPLVAGELIYVQTGQGGPVAVAVNRKDGSIAWRSQATNIAGYATPILADVDGNEHLIIFGGKAAYGMDPQSGNTLWEFPWSTSWDVNASTPIYRDGRLLLTSGYSSGGVMLELSATGPPRELWRSKDVESRFQPVIVEGDAIYVNSENKLTCVSWTDGRTLWRDDAGKVKLGLGGSFVRIPGDKMITMSERGKLSLVRATPAGVEVINTIQLLDGREVWATPLVYGGRLYAKGDQELVCYDISASSPSPGTPGEGRGEGS